MTQFRVRSTGRLPWAHRQRLLTAIVITAVVGVCAASDSRLAPAATASFVRERHPQTAWVACNRNAHNGKPSTFVPASDAEAARLITPEPETRPYNALPYTIRGKRYVAANDYVPTASQLQAYRHSHTSLGEPVLHFNPYVRYVDGRDGIRRPSTDDLIQWAAHKWGIPEDWLRAEYVLESYWNQFQVGDDTRVRAAWYGRYPYQARILGHGDVYQSMGLTQVRWTPNGFVGAGTEPLRWESTAFNVDEQAATLRFYYDNPSGARSSWGDRTYAPCEQWRSIGGWYSPYPWDNPGQAWYLRTVRDNLDGRLWASRGFLAWSPSSLPRGVTFR